MIASNMLESLTSSASMEVTLDIGLYIYIHIYIYIYSWVSMNYGRLFFYCANVLTTSLHTVNHSML